MHLDGKLDFLALVASAGAATIKTLVCHTGGAVNCDAPDGSNLKLTIDNLKIGQEIDRIACDTQRIGCKNTLKLGGSDNTKCALITGGQSDKRLSVYGLYNEKGDALFCGGTFYDGWGANGCSC